MDTQRKTSRFILVLRKHVKSQMITNGGQSISRNLFITKRSGRFPTTNSILLFRFSGRVVNTFFLLSNRQHHLNTCCPLNNAPRTKSRPAFSTFIFRCRLFFCVRRRCRHGSNRTSVDETIICAATTDDPNRSSTVCSCMLFTEAEAYNLTKCVYGWMIEILTDRVTHPVQREPKKQGCSTKLETGGGVEF